MYLARATEKLGIDFILVLIVRPRQGVQLKGKASHFKELNKIPRFFD